jgi:hypothetical protein
LRFAICDLRFAICDLRFAFTEIRIVFLQIQIVQHDSGAFTNHICRKADMRAMRHTLLTNS